MSLRGTVQNTTQTTEPIYGRHGAAPRARVRPARAPLIAAALILALAAGFVVWRGAGAGESVEAAQAAADSARAELEELTARVDTLESELRATTAALGDAEKADRSLANRLDGATDRLQKALDRLRKSTDAAVATAESAAASSSSALTKAEEAARRLNVLQERYDYHLRRYHGGG